MTTPSKPQAETFGQLKSAGYRPRALRDEVRSNLLLRLREGQPVFEGIVGYENTVIPQVINALLSRHNILLLGLRGQAKTRILRQMANLLDEWMPIVAGSEVNDDPFQPVSLFGREAIAQAGDATPIEWVHRSDRYREKLATPDVSIADLIGDLDPVKAAVGKLSFSHEAAILYGIIPRTNRGIFAVNELPDLQPRIQVGLFNILEEKDVQIRGFPVRLPLDMLLVFTANPEDYTNRGTIITPLKDRIESQILTHYPASIADALTITNQEAWTTRGPVDPLLTPTLRLALERIAFEARESEFVDQSSGVSARLPIAALENVLSNVERRMALTGETRDCVRVIDIFSALPAVTGKLELVYEGEQEGANRVATALIGKAIRYAFEKVFPGAYTKPAESRGRKGSPPVPSDGERGEYQPVLGHFAGTKRLELDDRQPFEAYFKALKSVTGLEEIAKKHLKPEDARKPEVLATSMELILEGLHQSSLLAKEDLDRGVLYSDMLGSLYGS